MRSCSYELFHHLQSPLVACLDACHSWRGLVSKDIQKGHNQLLAGLGDLQRETAQTISIIMFGQSQQTSSNSRIQTSSHFCATLGSWDPRNHMKSYETIWNLFYVEKVGCAPVPMEMEFPWTVSGGSFEFLLVDHNNISVVPNCIPEKCWETASSFDQFQGCKPEL